MGWVRLDDDFTMHPKRQRIPSEIRRDAIALEVAALAYSARVLSDGYVPSSILLTLGAEIGLDPDSKRDRNLLKRVQESLTSVGRFDVVPGGFQVHDYLEYQPRADDVKDRRKRDAERKRRSRQQGVLPDVPQDVRSESQADGGRDSERTPARVARRRERASSPPPLREGRRSSTPTPPTADAAAPANGTNLTQNGQVASDALTEYNAAARWLRAGGALEQDWRYRIEADFGVTDDIELAGLADLQEQLAAEVEA